MNATPQLTACPHCDLLLFLAPPRSRHSTLCPRCNALLRRHCTDSPRKALAFAVCGLLLFVPTLSLPLLRFDAFGFSDSATLPESIASFFAEGYYLVGILTALFVVLIPFVSLLLAAVVSWSVWRRRVSVATPVLFRWYCALREWSMVEVYLPAVLVVVIKMMPVASIRFLPGFFCCVALSFVAASLAAIVDKVFFWQQIEALREQVVSQPAFSPPLVAVLPRRNRDTVTPLAETARSAAANRLLLCTCCMKLLPQRLHNTPCPRCGALLHKRKPDSLRRTLALLLTAVLLLLPANMLPMMQVTFLGTVNRSTIFDGILYFFTAKSYLVGTVIFTASILVPFLKAAGLALLLSARRCASPALLRTRTRLYRFLSVIGRWSMLDIFVIALLAAAVDFGFVSSTEAAPAATWFCLAVPVTMLATHCFDPRILWDYCRYNESDESREGICRQ